MAQVRSEFALALNQICAERGIEPEIVIESIKQALLAAMRRDYQIEEEEILNYEAHINSETGAMSITKNGKDATPAGFGRIAAQVAKQVIMQRVREAEKDAIIDEYTNRINTMVTGMVLRFDGPNVVIDIGRGQGLMPPEDQIANEFYRLNQRVAVYIKEIRETYRGKAIIVSRSVPELIAELFKREVPEVNSGAVEIKGIAREAGHRTKLAVVSTQDGVDPVGSCVGQKGIRVQAIINELNGEKIDIIQYDKDFAKFITSTLAPAEGLEIEIDEDKKHAIITVPEDQISLAIGRGGQNARLAAKLTGYKIDIKAPKAKKATLSTSGKEMFEIDELGLSTRLRNAILEEGVKTIDKLVKNLDSLQKKLEELDERAKGDIQKSIERRERRKKQLKEEQEKLENLELLEKQKKEEQEKSE